MGAARAAAQQPESCGACHTKEGALEQSSAHSHEQVGCVACHGGDGAQADKEKAHAGQVKKIPRTEIPASCAKCHSDVRRMNPYGIATDQFAQYQTSRHGQKLAEGNTEVATCVDCHQSHGIRKVKDPQSSAYPANVPKTCGRCHSDAELMKRHDLPATAPKLWSESVHGKLLLEKGDLSAPTCVTCHGNHGAVPPGFQDISHVCGKCHVKQQELFSQTRHFTLTQEGSFQACVTCHRNHLIRKTKDEIGKSCKKCHEESDPPRVRFESIFATIRGSEGRLQTTRERVQRMARAGFHVDDEEVLLEEAKTSVLQLVPTQHTLSEPKVREVAQAAEGTMREIHRRLDAKERTEGMKKKALIPIWGFLLVMAGLFWLKLRQVKKRENHESGIPNHGSDPREVS